MRPVSRSLLLVLSSLVAVLVGSIVLAAGTATPAGAHAVVVSSSPSADERQTAPPSEVSILFSEAVTSDEFIAREVDPILDKMNAKQSLTERERRILEQAGKRINKR